MKHTVKVIPKEEILANRSNAYEFIDIETMKNIHILPTDKPSRLLWCFEDKRHYTSIDEIYFKNQKELENQNIYITNSEEIKEGDWCIDIEDSTVFKVKEQGHSGLLRSATDSFVEDSCKKIILTTDDQLIKDGVQAIDDEFLEWFVKNSSCEWVEVEKILLGKVEGTTMTISKYKIIIPKEEPKQHLIDMKNHEDSLWEDEPKQETLEEAAKKYANKIINGFQEQHIQENLEEYIENYNKLPNGVFKTYVGGYIDGAKWQQQNSYSEEEVLEIIYKFKQACPYFIKAWFEQFKKK